MPNYQNGKIYKIISPSNPDALPYFGATTMLLCKRMGDHRNKNNKCKSKSLMECGDAIIVLVENYPCNSKEELSRKEAEYIVNNDCCNKIVPLRTKKEWLIDNYDRCIEKRREWYRDNHDRCIEKRRDYDEKNREYIQERTKQYAEKNKEDIKKRQDEYRQINKETIKEHYSKQYSCICGGQYTHAHKKRHERNEIHQKYLQTISTEN